MKKPVTNTPNSGEQLSGNMKAALALLDRAMKLRLQLDRLGGPMVKTTTKEKRRHGDDEDGDPVKGYTAAKPRRPTA